MTDSVLDVAGLRTYFESREGIAKAVDGVSFSLSAGETLGLVGESGCGKSVTALSIMQLVDQPGRVVAGRVVFRGMDLLEQPSSVMRSLRGNEIAMIFQEPMTSLNPVHRVGDQVIEVLRLHAGMNQREGRDRAVELFTKVGIPNPAQRLTEYPHQLSGGLRQRVMIAMAVACRPKVLIADEPTTALDVTIQAQILELLRELREAEGTAVLMITHDLGVIAEVADRVAVMYTGKVVESGTVTDLLERPQHPYTQALLRSIPTRKDAGHRLHPIEGNVPHPLHLPRGCTFAPRCPARFDRCETAFPALERVASGHHVACYLHSDRSEEDIAAPEGVANE